RLIFFSFFSSVCLDLLPLHSFPTRRSSDLSSRFQTQRDLRPWFGVNHIPAFRFSPRFPDAAGCFIIGMDLHRKLLVRKQKLQQQDRKSTRLNSSHLVISYAVFCLKKKTNIK